jgi:hypothetical protein
VSINSEEVQSGAKRLEMTINGSPVVEIDLRASYLTIFHAWHGVQLDPNQDPYAIPGLGGEARDIVKLWVAATFGNSALLRKWPSDLLKGGTRASFGPEAIRGGQASG